MVNTLQPLSFLNIRIISLPSEEREALELKRLAQHLHPASASRGQGSSSVMVGGGLDYVQTH